MSHLYVLFEHAAGYALFRVKQFEEIGVTEKQVEASALELNKFNSVVKLIAFMPFNSAANALDNTNSISEGILHKDLQEFLETNLPKPGKKEQVILGVGDPKIGAAVSEVLSVACQHTGVVPEILRGIRYHFHNLIKGFTSQSADKAQLGLGHSYSRAKVKFNVHRVDNMIIQSISLLDQLDKDINTFSMRIREWYSYHFPELIKIVPDNYTFARIAQYIQNRKELNEDKLEGLEEIVMDSAKAQAILDASRSSMGMDISPIDLINIESFSKRVISLSEYRKKLHEYLKDKMSNVAPSLSALIGEQVGARLISHAGSLTNLAKYPASTVQILGAEKALFRALKTRGNTPKYGLIFHSTFIGRAAVKNKGRISRYLANKCSIASRIDCFSEVPTAVFGEHLRQQVEDRLKFYDSGETPKKNIDVMKEAMAEASVVQAHFLKKKKKRERKEKKQKLLLETGLNESAVGDIRNLFKQEPNEEKASSKKKKKRKLLQEANFNESAVEDISHLFKEEEEAMQQESSVKKKKKRKLLQEANFNESAIEDVSNLFKEEESMQEEAPVKKKKRKSLQQSVTQDVSVNGIQEIEMEDLPRKKKKKKKSQGQDD